MKTNFVKNIDKFFNINPLWQVFILMSIMISFFIFIAFALMSNFSIELYIFIKISIIVGICVGAIITQMTFMSRINKKFYLLYDMCRQKINDAYNIISLEEICEQYFPKLEKLSFHNMHYSKMKELNDLVDMKAGWVSQLKSN